VRREIVVSAVAGALAVLIAFLVGSDWPDALIAFACVVVAAALLVPGGELAWNYAQADKRWMMRELRAIRDRLEAPTLAAADSKAAEPPADVDLTLRNLIRMGRELRNRHSVAAPEERAWANSVVENWGPLAPREQVERFLNVDGASFRDQLAVLERIANETQNAG